MYECVLMIFRQNAKISINLSKSSSKFKIFSLIYLTFLSSGEWFSIEIAGIANVVF